MKFFHSQEPSDASSMYSTVLSTTSSVDDPTTFVFPQTQVKELNPYQKLDPYEIHNPYADSLWYKTRGEVGNQTIDDIKQRTKRKLGENQVHLPPRLESLTKKVDSLIKNENFFQGLDDVECDSPKYKGLGDQKEYSSAMKKYRSAVKELMVTEVKYRDDLLLTESVYRSVLQNSKKYKHILSNRQESIIFSNLETIADLSGLFIRDVTKQMSSICHGYFEFDIEKHFNLVDVSQVDIGDYLKIYFIRLNIAYASYFKNHKSQMAQLQQCMNVGGPKINKWLEECAYLARAKSDTWNLDALLIKPLQRLPKYLLMIDVLLESSDKLSYGAVENLYDAKSYLERLLDGLNSVQQYGSEDDDENEIVFPERGSSQEKPKDTKGYIGRFFDTKRVPTHTEDISLPENTLVKEHLPSEKKDRTLVSLKGSRQEYVDLVNEFKATYQSLKKLKKEIKGAITPLLHLVDHQRKLVEKWRLFMEYEDSEVDDYCIESIYSSYADKITDQESKTKLLSVEMDQKIGKALNLALDNCAAVKYRIKKHNSNRGAYVIYLKGQERMSEAELLQAQEYIVVENQIKDELPPLLEKLAFLIHFSSLLYAFMIQDWLKMMAGANQLVQYKELLSMGELQVGDNFDIIELYSTAKHSTRAALKDMCTPSSLHSHSDSMKIHSSQVVRRLFGI